MQYKELYSNWAEVDLGAIENNTRFICEQTRAQVMAVVKANGYGHGAVPTARAAMRGGAIWCGVARIEEALELRRAGLQVPILLLGYTPPGQFAEAIRNEISLTIWSFDQLEQAQAAAEQSAGIGRLHLKVDSGMSRLGVPPGKALELAQCVVNAPRILLEGIFTHFARADETDAIPTAAQLRVFQELLESLRAHGVHPPLVHAANSAASLIQPETYFTLVRPGISIYGLCPSPECPLPTSFRPALSWKTVLSQVKTLPAGRGVSYGHVYVTRGQERIGTIPIGYADGFRRTTGNFVLVGGIRVPIVGRVCMDQAMVQLDGVPDAKAGDEVVIIGSQGGEEISAEEVGRRWNTINYEVVCGIGARVPRVYQE